MRGRWFVAGRDVSWQKSSFSGGGEGNACVELAASADGGIPPGER
ncbi:DUF397 domain-containing protein [Actinacidiphila oryziradicis]